ncbi:MAG TPA: prolyl oligopeptidase family serine peptidase [Chitinophagaceae bacterium]
MKQLLFLLACIAGSLSVFSQKKPLDHSVYDGWQNIAEKSISNDGKLAVYGIVPQEGDGRLVIQATDNSWKKEIPRGFNAVITEDGRYVIFRIRPHFKDSRDARIKKKTPDQMPKDSLGIFDVVRDSLLKIPRVKSYKVPEKAGGWLAYQLEKSLPDTKPAMPDSLTRLNNLLHMADSLALVADSLRNKAAEAKLKGMKVLQSATRGARPGAKSADDVEEGTDLVVKDLTTGEEKKYHLVSEYYFSKKGNTLVVETTRKNSDSSSRAAILWVNTASGKTDIVMKAFNDAKNYAFDEDGVQLAFVAERDSVTKALQKFYKLWYYRAGMDSAQLRGDRHNPGVANGLTISSDYTNTFSKDGKRLFLGLAPIRPPKDTTLVEFETARLDVWNYNDDYLQPQQLLQAPVELKRSFLAVLPEGAGSIIPLGVDTCENVVLADEGNAPYALGASNKGYRIRQQWEGNTLSKLYLVNVQNGERKLVQQGVRGNSSMSPGGKFILWYNWKLRHWFTYCVVSGAVAEITRDIKVPLYDEEDDHPDDPPSHGSMGWDENDAHVYLYDKYDIWQCDPEGKLSSRNFTNGYGRKNKQVLRYIQLDREGVSGFGRNRERGDDKAIKAGEPMYLSVFDEATKKAGLAMYRLDWKTDPMPLVVSPHVYQGFAKAKNSDTLLFIRESYNESPDVFMGYAQQGAWTTRQLSHINPQQKDYNWYSVELRKWKMFDGKMSEGLLYKPENFDSTKKYPIIFYFYERNADTRYLYHEPAPSPSIINIAYFTSNGYLVFDPNIYYKNGEPGESAYNSVVSAANYLKKYKWVDSTKMALQGHSWAGYQIAYLVTRTNMFAAAHAGAPVANMTSAYSGIRWGAGVSREFQYEHGQSRIGYSPWQRLDLYLKNSPLFHADKITTPLLMMANDADGAVPWYQGIEFFSALRRLGKKAWMLTYNGEDHNLVERRNRKDLSIRLAQFFGYYLKGEKEPRWMSTGVPATLKGIDWGITEEAKKGY